MEDKTAIFKVQINKLMSFWIPGSSPGWIRWTNFFRITVARQVVFSTATKKTTFQVWLLERTFPSWMNTKLYWLNIVAFQNNGLGLNEIKADNQYWFQIQLQFICIWNEILIPLQFLTFFNNFTNNYSLMVKLCFQQIPWIKVHKKERNQ